MFGRFFSIILIYTRFTLIYQRLTLRMYNSHEVFFTHKFYQWRLRQTAKAMLTLWIYFDGIIDSDKCVHYIVYVDGIIYHFQFRSIFPLMISMELFIYSGMNTHMFYTHDLLQ